MTSRILVRSLHLYSGRIHFHQLTTYLVQFYMVKHSILCLIISLKFDNMKSAINICCFQNNMEDQHVPKTLRHRVISYFGHLWLRTKGVEIQSMFEDCPRCLLAEVSLTITRPMLETVCISMQDVLFYVSYWSKYTWKPIVYVLNILNCLSLL